MASDVKAMLEALECHTKPIGKENCADCRYECRNASWTKVQNELVLDLIEFLKDSQPRVLSFDEVVELKAGDVVWLEDVDKPTVVAGLVDRVFIMTKVVNFRLITGTVMADLSEYGDRWRAWSAKPDKKVMEATAWSI